MRLLRTCLIIALLLCPFAISHAQKQQPNRKVGIPEEIGDCNYDYIVDARDVVILANYLAGNKLDDDEVFAVEQNADIMHDGKINILDLSVMQKFIAGNIDALPVYPH